MRCQTDFSTLRRVFQCVIQQQRQPLLDCCTIIQIVRDILRIPPAFGGHGRWQQRHKHGKQRIDNAFSATVFFDKLMENKTYYNQYHAYLQQLVDKYVNGGSFDKFYERVHSQTEAETLYQVVKLRGKSIEGQLNGTQSANQRENTQQQPTDAQTISADDSAGKLSPADGENGKLQMGNPPGMDSDSRYSAAVRRFASAADSRAAVCSPVPQKTVQISY